MEQAAAQPTVIVSSGSGSSPTVVSDAHTNTPAVPIVPNKPAQVSSDSHRDYAGVWRRFFAVLLDGMILGFVGGFISGIFAAVAGTMKSSNPPMAAFIGLFGAVINFGIPFFYSIYFIGIKGQTPGKMILGVKVISEKTGEPPGVFGAIIREIIGKPISGLVLGLGYFWAFWDAKKQAWHDKIAGTVVVRV
jgi:uncharacterized RDD family membrane protein YckC